MTDGWTIGADVGTMLTGLSAATAALVWTRSQVHNWVAWRKSRAYRNWNGYITMGGIDSWYVRVAEEPETPSGRVVLDVVDSRGEPATERARTLRLRASEDGQLARVPTPDQYEFLKYLQKKQGYGKGGVIVE